MRYQKMTPVKFGLAIVGAVFVCLLALLGFLLISSNTRDNLDPVKQKEMMSLMLEWGRLAPFPLSASDVSIQAEGSSFTRSFRASFIASRQEIETWIINSPGLNKAIPTQLSDSKVQYKIVPKDGTNKAEVIIDYALNKVEIYVSWS